MTVIKGGNTPKTVSADCLSYDVLAGGQGLYDQAQKTNFEPFKGEFRKGRTRMDDKHRGDLNHYWNHHLNRDPY